MSNRFYTPTEKEYKRLLENANNQEALDQKELNKLLYPRLMEEASQYTDPLQYHQLQAQRALLEEARLTRKKGEEAIEKD